MEIEIEKTYWITVGGEPYEFIVPKCDNECYWEKSRRFGDMLRGRHRDPPLWPMDDPRRISLNWGNEPSTLIIVIKYLALAMIVSFVIWFLWPIKRAPVEVEEDEDEESESEFGEDTEAEYDIVKKDN